MICSYTSERRNIVGRYPLQTIGHITATKQRNNDARYART